MSAKQFINLVHLSLYIDKGVKWTNYNLESKLSSSFSSIKESNERATIEQYLPIQLATQHECS